MTSFKMKSIIANFSMRERVVFVVSITILTVGIFGGLVALSNRFSKQVPIHGGFYREGIIGSPRFINPVLASSSADLDLSSLVYSGLVRESSDASMEPDLASNISISPDGKTYTVSIKPNAVFQDGKPLTSADVAFTISKIQDPTLKSPLQVAWDGVIVSTPDAHTVVFTLTKPYAGFENQLNVGILPAHLWSGLTDEQWLTTSLESEPIGSGPYKVSSVSRSRIGVVQSISLKAFSKFELGKPYIENLSMVSFANTNDAESAFKSRSIDGLAAIDSEDIETTKTASTNILTSPTPRVFGLFFNPAQNPIFADQTVVKALNLAIDKNAIIQSVFNGYAKPLDGPLPEFVDTSTTDYSTNLALAAQILDEDGWKINPQTGIRQKTVNKTVETLSFSISTSDTPELQASANLISDQLQSLGVQTTVKVFEIGNLNQNVIQGRDFDALLFGEVVNQDSDLYAFWDSTQRTSPGLNITGYDNKHVDTLLQSAIIETDPAKQMAIYNQISQQLAIDAPVIFLYTPDFIYLINNNVQGVTIPTITDSSDRFSQINQWYVQTDHVWKAFLTK